MGTLINTSRYPYLDISDFLSENFQCLVVKFSIYLNRRVFVMYINKVHFLTLLLFVLRFYGPVNPMGSCQARSVYLTTRLLGRLCPLSGLPVLCTFFRQKLTTALLESAEGRE